MKSVAEEIEGVNKIVSSSLGTILQPPRPLVLTSSGNIVASTVDSLYEDLLILRGEDGSRMEAETDARGGMWVSSTSNTPLLSTT